jgi:hypothetical protein
MAFTDNLYLVIGMALLIVTVLSGDFIIKNVLGNPTVQAKLPAQMNASANAAWTNNQQFADNSFAAIFFIFGAISIGLTIFLQSHPLFMVAWLFFCIILFFTFDILTDALTPFMSSSLNTGAMNNAWAFFHGDMPKGLMVLNVLLGAVLFGKRAGFVG